MNRRDQQIVTGGVAALLALVAGFWFATIAPAEVVASPMQGSAATAGAGAHAETEAMAGEAIAAATSMASAAMPGASEPTEPELPPGHIEVCGHGFVPAPPAPRAESASDPVPADADILSPWVRQWQAQATMLGQALAAVLKSRGDDWSFMRGLALEADVEAMARLARNTTDGRAYGLARRFCQSPDAQALPACQQLNPERWAQLEPDNVAPWLALIEKATRAKDRSGLEAALHRAALARRVDLGFGALSDLAADPSLEGAELGPWGMFQIGLIGNDAAAPIPNLAAGSAVCSKTSVRDANRQQTCAALARLMLREGRSSIDKLLGAGIGKHVGLPEEELAATRTAWERGTQAMVDVFGTAERQHGCRALRRVKDWARERARDGEWAAAQSLLRPAP